MKTPFTAKRSRGQADKGTLLRPDTAAISRVPRLLFAMILLTATCSYAEPANNSTYDRTTGSTYDSYKGQAEALRPKISWFRRHFGRLTWAEAIRECKTPKDICKIISSQIGYKSEEVDHWYSARDTWIRGQADCEDFAICVMKMCEELGFESNIYLFFPKGRGQGHAVVVGTWNGQLWMSSDGSFSRVSSLDEVEENVAAMLWSKPKNLWHATMTVDTINRRVDG